MSVKLRMQRHGAKKRPFYRIIAADHRARRDGRFLEVVGTYDPLHDPVKLRLKQDRVNYWLDCGAQPSDTVRSLLRKARRNPDTVTFLSGAPAGVVAAAEEKPATPEPAAEAAESEGGEES